jgi:4-amino-4-deoxy-L-arabinose transferase-like glycosyltransferase
MGYPTFLAGVYFVWGHSVLAAQIANALLGVATVLLTFLVARRLTTDGRALLAAALVAFTPSHVLYSSVLATENLFTVLFMAFIWLMWPSPVLKRYVSFS